jgi:hypothetical protein
MLSGENTQGAHELSDDRTDRSTPWARSELDQQPATALRGGARGGHLGPHGITGPTPTQGAVVQLSRSRKHFVCSSFVASSPSSDLGTAVLDLQSELVELVLADPL